MAAAAAPNPQHSLYEKVIEDPELEALLVERQKKRDAAGEARKKAAAVHEQVKEKLEHLDLADAPVRIGGFVVAYKPVSAREVSFTANATQRLVIKPLNEE